VVAGFGVPNGPPKPTIAFLGMGIMGVPMVKNLLKAGYEVAVWNRTESRCEELLAANATLAKSPREAAAGADITFAMLSDPAAALAVAEGPDGVAAGMAPGKGYVDVSTVDAETSAKVAALVREAGGQFLEAPVSGSKGPAINGQLIFLAAGDEALYGAASPMLDVMGKAKFYLGDVGAGAKMKLVVNMVMGSMMTAFSEGLVLGEEAGLDAADILEVVSLGAIAAPMFALKGPTMVEGAYAPAFPLKHQLKDMKLALQLGHQLGRGLPTAEAATELYVAAEADGLGDKDFSGVHESVKNVHSHKKRAIM